MEVGPGDILSSLIAETLPESACVQTCIPPAEGAIYTTALARLVAEGHLKIRGEPRFVSLAGSQKARAPGRDTPAGQAPAALAAAPELQDHLEALIHIIMDATGFNRDEIQPDMDLRRDLSIRSSRLPIIMDAAERHFGITIDFEDFMQVRTVKDIAQRISTHVARQEGPAMRPAAPAAESVAARAEVPEPSQDEASLKRLTFNLAPVEPAVSAAIKLSPGESVLLLSSDKDDEIAKSAGDVLRRDYGVDTVSMPFMQERVGPGEEGHDILAAEGAARASEKISGMASLVGMVITLPDGGSGRLEAVADVSRLLRGLFPLLKAFLQSPTRKFVVLVHSRKDADSLSRLLAEGLLGLFLSAAQEHPAVQFRTVEIDRDTDLGVALRGALDRGCPEVELIHREGKVFTSQGSLAPSAFRDSPGLTLSPGDVVVMSGGATGISVHLARSLAPFSPRLVFLGRTTLDAGADSRAAEIARTLADFHASGIEATFHTCDVTDPEAVRAVLGEVVGRYGRIDGIVHGAGVLRDGWLGQMSPEDFSRVADVKFLGA
ncbi:MAG: SDR family NAD(P)-dependent oxidoreductase, partial [Planctomycetota bacterium]|nr:SDR family NAD(P)-dependent oxidoreductase [Planctomycetota bacterium]